MDISLGDFSEIAHNARRGLEREREELTERAEQLEAQLRVLEEVEAVMKENRLLREENEELQQQLLDERQQRAEVEMKLMEMSKLSTGMAKKASHDDLQKALRIYLNTSKRKTQTKREAAKIAISEMLTSAKLEMPDDIMDLLDNLDDEQPEAPAQTTVNVHAGGINIQHVDSVRK